MTMFAIQRGRLMRDGEPFLAVGVNYHPRDAGCRIWTDGDPASIEADFAAIVACGFNTVRLFVFWRDFEPEPGQYRSGLLTKVRETVDSAASAGLACVISLLTIWMNGQLLDLPWRQGRNLLLDPEMIVRQEQFAAAVGRVLRGADAVMAIDLGDEIGNVSPTPVPSRCDVAEWNRRLAAVLRRELPGVPVMQANDVSGVLGRSPFGPDNAHDLDLVAIHGFPTWSPGCIESTEAYKATNLAPFLVRFAAAYGVPFIDELGSYGVGDDVASRYLRAAAASCVANGASGVLAWCWQDIASVEEPYQQRPTERGAGLRRLDGTAKPALHAFARVAANTSQLSAFRHGATRTALYIPECARAAGESYLDAKPTAPAIFYAYLLLKRAHLDVDFVTGALDGYRLVVCPSVAHVTARDLERLSTYVEAGGVLYYSMGDRLHGFPGGDLAGVDLVDFTLDPTGKSDIRWDNEEWPIDWHTADAPAVTVRARKGECLARFPDGTPAVVRSAFGEGQVVFCAAPFESQLDRPGRLTADRNEQFYRRVAELAGVSPDVDCDNPDIEIVPLVQNGPERAAVINHGTSEAQATLLWRTGSACVTTPILLAAKDFCVADRPAREGLISRG